MPGANKKKISVLAGDGIGPEVVTPALAVLTAVAEDAGFELDIRHGAIGGDALDRFGVPLPDETLEVCLSSDAILLGAVGGPRWDSNPPELRPEKGLLGIRKGLALYGNLRPVRQMAGLLKCSTLKPEVGAGVDLVVVRELTGGLYFGKPRGITGTPGEETGFNTMIYQRHEIDRIARQAFELARIRRKRVTSVDKANVLEVSRLWRQVVNETWTEYPDVELSHQYVDNCAMQMVLQPSQFDVILTENTFGDILSDIGGVLTGSIGTLPSASLGDGPALYEPVHGSAPDIAGRDLANPIGAIGCIALMLEISFGRADLARRINGAIEQVIADGFCTADLAGSGGKAIGTTEFSGRVMDKLALAGRAVAP
ncbi:MAG TPA: 3-isopropylmalate dehydrogenase [Acidobacteriota bacterium]|nr:3-isopropylmalate dehydrogenase [Acidobacteriota bacterium]